MNKFFGFPILLAFLLGYYFPYFALSNSSLAFFILIIMMTLVFIQFDFNFFKELKKLKLQLFMGIVTAFVFTPIVQWLLARFFVHEESLSYGTYIASLCPIAIVAPMFTAHKKGNVALSFLFMITTTILFPIFFALHLMIFKSPTVEIKIGPVFLDAFLLIIVPLILAVIAKIFFKGMKESLAKITPNFNMLAIAFFAFVYFGASTSKLNLYYTPITELIAIILIILFQDFGTYFFSRWFFSKIFSEEDAKALAISLGMKNFAITGGLLLFYDPKASLASAIGFFIHALYYNFLSYKD